MKKYIVVLLLFAGKCYCQDTTLPRVVDDTIYTSSGYKVIKGQKLKIGIGSTPDGDFKYIRVNSGSMFNTYGGAGYNNAGANNANAFSRKNSGLQFEVIKVEEKGNKKHGYVPYAKIQQNGLLRYEIDIENAIRTGEIDVPDEFKPKAKALVVEVKGQQLSVADELVKLKKLKDDGIITQDEFDAQKKKLLGQ